MDAIEKAIAVLRQQGKDIEEGIAVLTRIRGNTQAHTYTNLTGQWTDAQRKAASRRAKAQWRKRKAARAQNRVTVAKVAAKKKG